MSYAFRNVRLCAKDCMCLFVCPTGATDHEIGQIDASKCIDGCRACVDACPEHAISLKPAAYLGQQRKTPQARGAMLAMAAGKCREEAMARGVEASAALPGMKLLAKALVKSVRIAAEDMIREAGFMLPQSGNAAAMLRRMVERDGADGAFPSDVAASLLTAFEAAGKHADNY